MDITLQWELYGAIQRSSLSCQLFVLTTQGRGAVVPETWSILTLEPALWHRYVQRGTIDQDICYDLGLRLLH